MQGTFGGHRVELPSSFAAGFFIHCRLVDVHTPQLVQGSRGGI